MKSEVNFKVKYEIVIEFIKNLVKFGYFEKVS